MSKYIDADKFIKKFEKMIDDIPASVDSGAGYVIDEVYKIFDSLQQEQPQVADASKMEQPEVDFEKEIDKAIADYSFAKTIDSGGFKTTVIDYTKIARHFYELGLNARKEE